MTNSVHRFEAMNTHFVLTGVPVQRHGSMEKWFRDIERTFSRFNPASELVAVNNRPDTPVSVSPLFGQALERALAACRETEGFFNPFLGETMTSIGYDKSYELLAEKETFRRQPEATKSSPLSLRPDRISDPLTIDRIAGTVCLRPGMALDLGGFVKGWSAQLAAETLRAEGVERGMVDAGGDISLWVNDPDGDPWGITVDNPFKPGNPVGELWLRDPVGLATSSITWRRWKNSEGHSAHHIVDPRTGRPAASDYVQATILHPDLAVAEVLAKCMIILGSAEGPAWLTARRPEAAFIAVDHTGTVSTGGDISNYCVYWQVQPSCEVEDDPVASDEPPAGGAQGRIPA